MTQLLRRSQFITTYGPGAILEGPDGPRVIRAFEQSGIFNDRAPADLEITDLRLSQTLLNGAGIFRLPSNAELGLVDSYAVYGTFAFPEWSLCVRHQILYRKTTSDNRACPQCPPLPSPQDAWRQARQQAIRFVQACGAGHLDDVDWLGLVHRGGPSNCTPAYLLWKGGGGALRHITIACPTCKRDVRLGQVYAQDLPCSGRFPEWNRDRPGCGEPARIIQRGAANVRIPEIVTALTIPPRTTQLHRLLELDRVQTLLISRSISTKQELLDALQPLVKRRLLRQSIVDEIKTQSEQAVQAAIRDTISHDLPANQHDLLLQEFNALRHAADHGSPPHPSATPGAPPQFEVIREHVRTIDMRQGLRLRVTPINRLRVVMVQTGYRRMKPQNQVVRRAYDDGGRFWYPGVELFGEGIFIDLHIDPISKTLASEGGASASWFTAWLDPERFGHSARHEERYKLHPMFVWWHTLAHRLINALSVDSGYSSASVRERIFVDIDDDTGNAGGGILLYTAQPGGDGTLGGMVALVPEFERVLDTALRDIDSCSNDPLCDEERFGPSKYNGAACYACLLVSETSCEHRNMYLDRHVLLESLSA